VNVLIGEFNGKSRMMPYLERHGWGRMWASYGPAWSYDGEPWGFDNGAFRAWRKGESFPVGKFRTRIERAMSTQPHPPCVAVLPDVVGDGVATLAQAEHWLPRLPNSWPWFLAVQDGIYPERVRRLLPRVAGLFLGGTDAFKRTAGMWCDMAHGADKLFHFARCNREAWIRSALDIGADSIDTTRPLRALTGNEADWFRLFERMVTRQCKQKTLGV
jgi:hypothetical protein